MSSKSPLRAVEPEPERNPSPAPAPRDPSPSGAYSPYHPAGYTPQPYNPQNFPPSGSGPQPFVPGSHSGPPVSATLSGPLLSDPPPSSRPLSGPPGSGPLDSNPHIPGPPVPGPLDSNPHIPGPPVPGPPQLLDSPLPRPVSGPPASAPSPRPQTPGLPPRSESDPQIQDRPAPTATDLQQKPASFGPVVTTTVTTTGDRDLKSLKTNCQFALREYLSLQRQRSRYDGTTPSPELETRIRNQGDVLLGELKFLQGEVRSLVKKAENHRWRKWIIGGAIASFIPIIRKFWRRGDDKESEESSNDTEYAFKKSQGLLEHIKNSLLGKGRFAQIAFMVFAVLYVFSNEVSLRVAKTTHKRVKKLCARIERGDPDIGEHDMKLLDGWRWRILLW